VFVLLLVRTKFPPPGRVPAGLFFQADFYLALMTFLSTGHPAPNWYLALTMGFAVFVFGNFFCFWICPFGSGVDLLNLIFFRRRWPLRWKLPRWCRSGRYILLGLMVSLSAGIFFRLSIPFVAWLFDPFGLMVRGLTLKNWPFLVLLVVISGSIILPRSWCFYLCPLGTCYTLLAKARGKILSKKGRGDGADQPS